MAGEHDTADRPGIQHLLHGVLLHQGADHALPVHRAYIFCLVHCCLRQVVVHARAVLLC